MRPIPLGEAYHIERALAARQGIQRYPCGCEKCHGFKSQSVQTVETHHRKYGRDNKLNEPLLRNPNIQNDDRGNEEEPDGHPPLRPDTDRDPANNDEAEEVFLDAEDYAAFQPAPPNTEVNFEEMAENYFARVDEIHGQFREEEDDILDFEDMSDEEEEPDVTPVVEALLREAMEPLYLGSHTTRLQFSIILMSLCTLFSFSHHCLDEILTFLKYDVLPVENTCPKSSYEMKSMLMKLGLSHETIHCCECGRTLYWREKSELEECPVCHKSRYIPGSRTVPVRVLRYFSLIRRLRRMYRCPEIAKHMRWHSSNKSQDSKMRSVVDSEQWSFIQEQYPSFSREARNVRMGLALDGVNPHSLQSSKHSVWPVMIVFYNLPPYLITKRFFISLSMIIPGPNSPSEDTIDVFLEPLVHELKKIWVGVNAIDMSEPPGPSRSFRMRGMLLWTINDYPAYTLISGQTGKGYAGCPVCGEGTFAEYSKEAQKTVYMGNRRWLKHDHHWRVARGAFNGQPNHDPPPVRQSGLTTRLRGAWRESFLQFGGRPNSQHDPVKKTGVKRISILFQLPYWEKLPTRHTFDAMHCEKNICENLLKTLFGETDDNKSREDMRVRGIRPHLHLQRNPDGRSFFKPDAAYVLTKDERQQFLTILRELKFPAGYVGPLSSRIADGKLRGLKTHDFHVLLQQVIPLCLRNIGNPRVVGSIMRVSRLFRNLCAKVIDVNYKATMLEEVAETICSLEKELPPSVFVIMMHLPIHLVEELFICGPVQTRWMYPFERYMKGLKGFVKNKAKPEGSMAHGYLREESVGFLNEYLSQYTPTTKRAWDDKEEPAMYDEILEGAKRDRVMTPEFMKLIHEFVLNNTEHMEPYRRTSGVRATWIHVIIPDNSEGGALGTTTIRVYSACPKYEEQTMEREQEREQYRRSIRRRGRRTRFAFPRELQSLPPFSEWVQEEIRHDQREGVVVDQMVRDTSTGPLRVATAYKSMYAFGNHFRVISSERHLRTSNSGVAATFRQACRNNIHDANLVQADIEYVGHIEEILELNYKRHCLVVLVCNFVKANYRGENATIKRDKWGFTLANYERRFRTVCRDSFAFPSHCEQVFYSNAKESRGWRVVLRNEVRGRRVLPNSRNEEDAELFQMGRDEEFEGLRPEREVGEEEQAPAATGVDVYLEPVNRRIIGRRGRRGAGGRNRVGRGGRHGGRGGRVLPNREGAQESGQSDSYSEESAPENLYGQNDVNVGQVHRRGTDNDDRGNRNVRRRHVQEESISSSEDSGSEEESVGLNTTSTEDTSSSSNDSQHDEE